MTKTTIERIFYRSKTTQQLDNLSDVRAYVQNREPSSEML